MVGERQGDGMGTAWERHGMFGSALRLPDSVTLAQGTFGGIGKKK
jgi:hypothetical protein